jgi:tRNA modification GTPase
VEKKAASLADNYEAGRGIREGIKIVIAGSPNSGKSSLLNALLGYDRAMVSRNSGTTRDTLEARLEIDGFSVLFTDTAGLNARASSALEKEGIKRAQKAIESADTVLLVKDSSVAQTAGDSLTENKILSLAAKGAKVVRVYNKSDLKPKRKSYARGSLKISARTGQGMAKLRQELISEQKKVFRDGTQAVVTSARHFAALSAAAAELQHLGAVMRKKTPPLELAAEHLRAAMHELSSIIGETAPEEVLADIFSNFCVGK